MARASRSTAAVPEYATMACSIRSWRGRRTQQPTAASYAMGLAKNHPFADGNKRAAFLVIGLFLYLNGYRLHADQAQATLTMFPLAAGDIDEDELAHWLRDRSVCR